MRFLCFGLPHSVVQLHLFVLVTLRLWTRVLKELTYHKIDKEKSPWIVHNETFRHLVYKISRSAPRTSQLSSLHALLIHSFKIHFNIICLSSLQSLERYLLHVLELQASMYFCFIRQDVFHPFHFPWFITPMTFSVRTTNLKVEWSKNIGLINPLNAELNPIYYLLALLAHHFLHVSRIRVKSLTLRLLMSYIYIYIYIYMYM